ncbi:glutathione S-transferase [Apodospora peruviana]|uniref:Glutathione S-transferase n=1 Tax=Apodospora peruviana TaxID=516989 RepID=A0AAE0II22_9PEZI|nr:glutathione S-transferase [Apodospora peruviana]
MSTSASPQQLPIVLYHYPYSPYAKRVVWYLQLRGIPYSQCLQPPILPRRDITDRLGIAYRRIPILSIGRDVYLDTRLIIRKLEELYPDQLPRLSLPSKTPEEKAIETLLQIYVIDGGVFARAAQLIPADLPLLKDPKFQKDRADFFGGTASGLPAADLRAEAVAEIKRTFAFLEETLLSDGRAWILFSGAGPSLADVEAVWPLHWLVNGLPGALPADQISADKFPKTFAWIARFNKAVSDVRKKVQVTDVKGEEAEGIIRQAEFNEQLTGKGMEQRVEFWPTDTGTKHRVVGTLVRVDDDGDEIVVDTDKGVRVHAPRHGFRVRILGPVAEKKVVANL